MNLQLLITVLSAFAVVVSVIAIGMRIEKFKHSHVSQQLCNKRYTTLHNKTTYTQLLLMEIATPEQKEKAECNMQAFNMGKKENHCGN